MTLLVSRAAPGHAFVASDTRHQLEERGEETALDLGPKIYALASGFGASGGNGASAHLVAVQAARLARDLEGADPGTVGRLLREVFEDHAPDPDPEDDDAEDPADGLHVVALRRGVRRFGAGALHADGRAVTLFEEGLFVSTSGDMRAAEGGVRGARERMERAWADGEEPADVEGDLVRLERLLAAARTLADDVSPELYVAGILGGGERFARRLEVDR